MILKIPRELKGMEEFELNETIEEMKLDEPRRIETGRVETRRDGDGKPPAGAHTAGTLLAREYTLLPRRSISLPARRRQSVFQLGHTAVGPLPGSTSGMGYSLAPRQEDLSAGAQTDDLLETNLGHDTKCQDLA